MFNRPPLLEARSSILHVRTFLNPGPQSGLSLFSGSPMIPPHVPRGQQDNFCFVVSSRRGVAYEQALIIHIVERGFLHSREDLRLVEEKFAGVWY